MNVQLFIIDPQYDFCDPNGALFVPGADKDCTRLAAMIRRLTKKIDDIHTTLDCHHKWDIAHPMFWMYPDDNSHPAPFTLVMKKGDMLVGINAGVERQIITAFPVYYQAAVSYVETLAANNRYVLCIWPEHCLIGSKGAAVQTDVFNALCEWEEARTGMVDYVTKGSNYTTEHYSAVCADVPDPNDPSTHLNMQLITVLQEADIIAISGQALSHCVANTITDVANNFGEDNIKKFVLIEDTCSNVPGFENLGLDFVSNMTKRGMQISRSDEFLK